MGTIKSLYVHAKDIGGVAFNACSDLITAEDGRLQILPGAPTGSDAPFSNVSKSTWSFSGAVEYALQNDAAVPRHVRQPQSFPQEPR